MKKVVFCLFVLMMSFTLLCTTPAMLIFAAKKSHTNISSSTLSTKPNIVAQTAVLIDASSGTVLYDKNCHKKMFPASITKIMTALLTIENCDLNDTITFTETTLRNIHYGEDANIGCKVGEKMKVKDALYALMLSSANEVATALGEHICGSSDKFASMMNERAKSAGATDTHFSNANGLHDENHYVTAYDMAMITKAALSYNIFQQIVNSTSYTIPKNNKRHKKFQSYQRHKMVSQNYGYYYDGIIGGKTGYTDQAGTTLVTCAKRNGMTLICVTLKSKGVQVYSDTKMLLDYGFENYEQLNISENMDFFNSTDVCLKPPFDNAHTSIEIDPNAIVTVPKGSSFNQLSFKTSFEKTDTSFATVSLFLDETNVGSAKIRYVVTTVPESENLSATGFTTNENETKTSPITNKNNHWGFIFFILVTVIGILVITIIIIKQKQKINHIRAQKRFRNKNY